MWEVNARLFYTTRFNMEPEQSTFVGAFPEDSEPTHVVYEMSNAPIEECGELGQHHFIVVELKSDCLIVRCADEKEVSDIKLLGTINSDNEEELEISKP